MFKGASIQANSVLKCEKSSPTAMVAEEHRNASPAASLPAFCTTSLRPQEPSEPISRFQSNQLCRIDVTRLFPQMSSETAEGCPRTSPPSLVTVSLTADAISLRWFFLYEVPLLQEQKEQRKRSLSTFFPFLCLSYSSLIQAEGKL